MIRIILLVIILVVLIVIVYKYSRRDTKVTKRVEKLKRKHLSLKEKAKLYLELSDIYLNGEADRYDASGRRIKGKEPDVTKAIEFKLKAIDLGYKKGYVELAKVFINERNPNVKMAKACYKKALLTIDDRSIRNEVYEGLDRIRDMQRTNFVDIQYPDPEAAENVALVADFIRNEREAANIDIAPRAQEMDSQNVHDSKIVSSIREVLHKLPHGDPSKAFKEFRAYILGKKSTPKIQDAIRVIDYTQSIGKDLTTYNLSEQESFGKVWKAAKTNDMKDNLIDELATAVEHGKVVCTMGRISRMVNSLSGMGVNIMTSDTLRKEMLNKASIVRDRLFDQLSKEDKVKVDSPTDNDVQSRFNETFKAILRDTYAKDYAGTVSNEFVTEELNKWIDDV